MKKLGVFSLDDTSGRAFVRVHSDTHQGRLTTMPTLGNGKVLVRELGNARIGYHKVELCVVESDADIAACNAEYDASGSNRLQVWYAVDANVAMTLVSTAKPHRA